MDEQIIAAPHEPNDLMRAKDVAAYLQMTKMTVYRNLARGVLPGTRVGRTWFIHRADLEALLDYVPPVRTQARRKDEHRLVALAE